MWFLLIRRCAMSSWLRPPAPGFSADLKTLLRENFTHQPLLPFVAVPKSRMQCAVRALRPLLLQLQRKIDRETESGEKVLLLDPERLAQHYELLCADAKQVLEELSITLPPPTLPVPLTYEHYKLEHVLKAVLPDDVRISAFSQIGHIAHLNLRPEALPFKFLIGQAIIDKMKIVKTVVNKTDHIDSTFRFFQMELLAGEKDFVATQSCNGCNFRMDFSKVYWNTRLSTEHSRLASQLQPGDVLYDAFAGVGPFAVPVAKKGCRVLANDLNPESARWLRTNVQLNSSRRSALAISCFNLDARQFLQTAVAGDYRWEARCKANMSDRRLFLVMNLPALAVTFLDALKYLPNPRHDLEGSWDDLPELNVRCYCFLRDSPNNKSPETISANNEASAGAANEITASNDPSNENATLSEAANENATLSGAANENATLSGAANENATLNDPANENATLSGAVNENATLNGAANQESASYDSTNEAADSKEVALTKENVLSVVMRTMRVRQIKDFRVHFVRNVATSKDMYRLDFTVTGAMFRQMAQVVALKKGQPPAKRMRCGDE